MSEYDEQQKDAHRNFCALVYGIEANLRYLQELSSQVALSSEERDAIMEVIKFQEARLRQVMPPSSFT